MNYMVAMMFRDGLYNDLFEIEAESEESCIRNAIVLFDRVHISGNMESTMDSIARRMAKENMISGSGLQEYFYDSDIFLIYLEDGKMVKKDVLGIVLKILNQLWEDASMILRKMDQEKRLEKYRELKKEFEGVV